MAAPRAAKSIVEATSDGATRALDIHFGARPSDSRATNDSAPMKRAQGDTAGYSAIGMMMAADAARASL